ncbi:hypothetical protein OKW96_12085 [Sphingobacterium sp. KU25419]|nr:hypothetical protein OKW96_12085 [Sphingobacterium sp. KU25419]
MVHLHPLLFKGWQSEDKNQYTLYGSHPPFCEGHLRVCAIQAKDHNKKPHITCDLEEEICCALENQMSTTNVLLKGSHCKECD